MTFCFRLRPLPQSGAAAFEQHAVAVSFEIFIRICQDWLGSKGAQKVANPGGVTFAAPGVEDLPDVPRLAFTTGAVLMSKAGKVRVSP